MEERDSSRASPPASAPAPSAPSCTAKCCSDTRRLSRLRWVNPPSVAPSFPLPWGDTRVWGGRGLQGWWGGSGAFRGLFPTRCLFPAWKQQEGAGVLAGAGAEGDLPRDGRSLRRHTHHPPLSRDHPALHGAVHWPRDQVQRDTKRLRHDLPRRGHPGLLRRPHPAAPRGHPLPLALQHAGLPHQHVRAGERGLHHD
ncbi:hypothetical protein Q9966_013480 [Columba livia]|nr:hypothetical protein Q9966_013480 [Columba livia]